MGGADDTLKLDDSLTLSGTQTLDGVEYDLYTLDDLKRTAVSQSLNVDHFKAPAVAPLTFIDLEQIPDGSGSTIKSPAAGWTGSSLEFGR